MSVSMLNPWVWACGSSINPLSTPFKFNGTTDQRFSNRPVFETRKAFVFNIFILKKYVFTVISRT